jgi:hypothetical protein
MDTILHLRPGGELTLPATIQERYHLQPGDALRLLDLDGLLVVTPLHPLVPALASELERLRVAAGLSMPHLFAALRTQRTHFLREQYGYRRT